MSSVPKDAAAIILLKQDTDPQNPEVFWVRRSDKLAFLGGFHAFPGGQIDAGDAEVDVKNAPDAATSATNAPPDSRTFFKTDFIGRES